MLYQWSEREEPLGSISFTALQLKILSLTEAGGKLNATGSIDTMDYVEACPASHLWRAVGTKYPQGVITWAVSPDEEDSFWTDRSGKSIFTLSETANAGIAEFVASKLNRYLALRQQGSQDTLLVEARKVYNRSMISYEGPCVCRDIEAATEESPFPWHELTGGGQFPQNCFRCSCGRAWWHAEMDDHSRQWLPVVDEAAWQMLIIGNGELTQSVSFMDGGIQLVRTLRGRGLIPLG